MKCPECNNHSILVTPIVKYRNTGGWKVVGEESWCIRRGCNYQEERSMRGI